MSDSQIPGQWQGGGQQYDAADAQWGHRPSRGADKPKYATLSRRLYFFHIFAIAISGVIGFGLFHDSGLILHIAGPAGTITSFGFVWLVAIAVMEGIGEMVGLWPVPLAFYEFVKEFVDQDFAWLIGIAYWYTYAMGTQALIIATATVVDYWGMSDMLKGLVLFFGAPIGLLGINLLGVKVYGNVELIAGTMKIIFFFAAFVISLALNFGDIGTGGAIHAKCNLLFNGGSKTEVADLNLDIDDEWTFNPAAVNGTLSGIAAGISLSIFAFIGVELVAITAFEAHNRSELRQPLRLVAWIVGAIYFIGVATFVSNIKWCDPSLPDLWDQRLSEPGLCYNASSPSKRGYVPGQTHVSNSLVVIALLEGHANTTAGYVNSSLIVVLLSAANTALYVSSRTLFGLTRTIDPAAQNTWLSRKLALFLQRCGSSHGRRKTPSWALVFSWVVFCWLPFLTLTDGDTALKIQQVLSSQGSISCLIVWASQCWAFIRYNNRLWKHKNLDNLKDRYHMYDRWDPDRPAPMSNFRSTRERLDDPQNDPSDQRAWIKPVSNWWFERKTRFKEKRARNPPMPVTSWLASGQPAVATFGLVACLVIIFGLATATWWEGDVTVTRALSIYLLPVLIPCAWVFLKILRAGGPCEFIKQIVKSLSKMQNPFWKNEARRREADANQQAEDEDDWRDLRARLDRLTALAEANVQYGGGSAGIGLQHVAPVANGNLAVPNVTQDGNAFEEASDMESNVAERMRTISTTMISPLDTSHGPIAYPRG